MAFPAIECEERQRAPRHEEEDVGDPRRGGGEEGIIRQRSPIVAVHERDNLGDSQPLPKVSPTGQHRDQTAHRHREQDQ